MTVANRILLRRCATCETHFEHGEGGTCASCGQIFCARHLYGRLALLMRKLRPERMVCPACRRKGNR